MAVIFLGKRVFLLAVKQTVKQNLVVISSREMIYQEMLLNIVPIIFGLFRVRVRVQARARVRVRVRVRVWVGGWVVAGWCWVPPITALVGLGFGFGSGWVGWWVGGWEGGWCWIPPISALLVGLQRRW